MNTSFSRQLNKHQEEALQELVRLCRSQDHFRLSCPLDGDFFYLMWDDEGRLASVIAGYQYDFLECRGFTRPDCRRKGYFRRLWELLKEDFRDHQLVFSADPRSQTALKTLEAIGARLWYQEYAMGLELNSSSPSFVQPASFTLSFRSSRREPGLVFVTARGKQTIGSCRLFLEGSRACLFSFEIHPSLRGQGLGYAFLCQLILQLCKRGVQVLNLQVSGQNLPALNLYKKTGFRIWDTLSYYLYESGESSRPFR